MRHTGTGTPALLEWSFGDRLRKVRREVAQLGQAEFAAQLDVALKAYSAWESGRTTPRELVAIAKRIELVTGVPAAWMLGIEEVAVRPAMTGTDAVTRRVTLECSAGNSAKIIRFPQVGKPPSSYPSIRTGPLRSWKRFSARRTSRHTNAKAVV